MKPETIGGKKVKLQSMFAIRKIRAIPGLGEKRKQSNLERVREFSGCLLQLFKEKISIICYVKQQQTHSTVHASSRKIIPK